MQWQQIPVTQKHISAPCPRIHRIVPVQRTNRVTRLSHHQDHRQRPNSVHAAQRSQAHRGLMPLIITIPTISIMIITMISMTMRKPKTIITVTAANDIARPGAITPPVNCFLPYFSAHTRCTDL